MQTNGINFDPLDLKRPSAAERSVLASMLRDNAVIGDVVQIVRAEDFRENAHQIIFATICRMFMAGKPVDLVTLAEELYKANQLDDVGRHAYLGELWDAEPTAANAEYYSRIVRDLGICRRLVHVAAEITRDAQDPREPADAILESAEKKIFEVSQLGRLGESVPMATAASEACDRIDAMVNHESRIGVATGLIDLDMYTAGLQPSELIILAARPSIGKTALGLGIAVHAAMNGSQVFFASLEQSRVELAERALCSMARVDNHCIRRGHLNKEDIDRLARAREKLRSAKMEIDDGASQNMLRIAGHARRIKSRGDLRLVVVDYLQLIEPESRREPRHEQVSAISRRLKHLARELKVPVLAMAQLNRASEERSGQEPKLADLRESGGIEADADTVLLMHRPDPDKASVQVRVAKQRNGPIGAFLLCFIAQHTRFENHTTEFQRNGYAT